MKLRTRTEELYNPHRKKWVKQTQYYDIFRKEWTSMKRRAIEGHNISQLREKNKLCHTNSAD